MQRKSFLPLAILLGLMLNAVSGYADDSIHFVPSVAQVEASFEFQLNTRFEPYGQPKATSYYDDKVIHYEMDQLKRDTIDEGIR